MAFEGYLSASRKVRAAILAIGIPIANGLWLFAAIRLFVAFECYSSSNSLQLR
jgi:hypothetical protein